MRWTLVPRSFSVAYRYGKEGQMHGGKCIGQEWVHATLNTSDLTLARLLKHPNFSAKIGCCDGVRGGGWFQDCFSVAYGYGKEGQMHGSKCIGQEWVLAALNTFDLTLARLIGRSKLSFKIGCSDGVWDGGWFQDCFSLAYGYGKELQMHGRECAGH